MPSAVEERIRFLCKFGNFGVVAAIFLYLAPVAAIETYLGKLAAAIWAIATFNLFVFVFTFPLEKEVQKESGKSSTTAYHLDLARLKSWLEIYAFTAVICTLLLITKALPGALVLVIACALPFFVTLAVSLKVSKRDIEEERNKYLATDGLE